MQRKTLENFSRTKKRKNNFVILGLFVKKPELALAKKIQDSEEEEKKILT